MLLNLASKDFSFNPLINRGDSIEKNQYLLWDKLNKSYVSSYTRAIIIGALCYRHFELQYLSFFDQYFPQGNDSNNDPIKIDTMDELLDKVIESQRILKKYQLSLEDNAPRQVVPIALKNFNVSNNPYSAEAII